VWFCSCVWCYLTIESHGRRGVHLTCYSFRHSHNERTVNIPVNHMSLTALNIVRSESRCALTKGAGSDVHEHLYRPESELN
jgi:hypothetical protein